MNKSPKKFYIVQDFLILFDGHILKIFYPYLNIYGKILHSYGVLKGLGLNVFLQTFSSYGTIFSKCAGCKQVKFLTPSGVICL